jgi:hypothetical protein
MALTQKTRALNLLKANGMLRLRDFMTENIEPETLARLVRDGQVIRPARGTICLTTVPDDGVIFDIDGLRVAPIREDLEYGGMRVQTHAVLDGARIPIQVDIGFGDIITPGPVEIDYPVLLNSPAPIRLKPLWRKNSMQSCNWGLPIAASKTSMISG